MQRRTVTLPIRAQKGLVVLLVQDPSHVEVRGNHTLHHVLDLESPVAVFGHLMGELADMALDSVIVAVVPTDGNTLGDEPGSNGAFLRGIAAEIFREDGAGGVEVIKQSAPRPPTCGPECIRGQRQGLPQCGAVAAHQAHGGRWRETDPDTGTRRDYALRCSPRQAGAIEYFDGSEWLFCAEPGWSRGWYEPIRP